MTVLKQFALSREKAEMSIFSETTCKRKGQLEVPARAILLSLFCTIKEFPTKYLYALHCVPLRGTTIQMCDNGNYSGTFLAPPAAALEKEGDFARKGMQQTNILVIGGGIAGTATACYLAQYGHEVTLLEQH